MNLNTRKHVVWALAVGLLLAGAVTATTLEETFDQTYAFAPGDLLELDNTNGNVYIEAWDRQEIHILATKKIKASSSAKAEAAMQDLQIEVEPRLPGEPLHFGQHLCRSAMRSVCVVDDQ